MKYANNVLELIGNTPLVKLNSVTKGLKPLVLAKVEYMNPGGSVKDRIGITMVEAAEKAGLLKPGGTIVEPTSGNTGVGLAMAAALKGYKCVFVMPDKMSQEKIRLLRAYGAEVVVTPTNVEPEDPESYYSVSTRLAKEIPNGFKPNQYANMNNPEAHYNTTGPEIWEQTEGKIDIFVAGMGTGGTISGVAKYLKEKNPKIQIVGADPYGSLYSGDVAKPYKVEGIGEDFFPETMNLDIIDEKVTVYDKESFVMTRRLAREEGLLVGGSCGSAVMGTIKYIQKYDLGEDKVVVVLLPDSGRNYLSKIFSDDWMKENGFMNENSLNSHVIDLVNYKGNGRGIISIESDKKVIEAIEIMKKNDVSQLPVFEGDKIVGSVEESVILNKVLENMENSQKSVKDFMAAVFPTVNLEDRVEDIYKKLHDGSPAIIVLENNIKPVDLITKMDLITFLGGK
ncbi:MAG: cystathionine beta-synthase [Candidatus Sericytochromatia bacterium]